MDWRNVRRLTLAAGFVLLGACREEEPVLVHTPDPSTVRTVAQGDLVGFTKQNGAAAWLGIPYAQPPVGDLRWRAPRDAQPWSGQLEAVEHPEWCPQITNQLDEFYGITQGELRGSEDCLYMNIYAPSGTPPAGGWPVMVWLHGGANIWGRASQYDGSILAEEQDVVVVIPQYRIGPLGAFSTPEIRNSAEDLLDESPNFGFLDAVAALEWVNGNISAFGGDDSRVTLFGESSGAVATLALHVSPLAQDLFQGSIAESGVPISISVDQAENGGGNSVNHSAATIDRMFPNDTSPSAQDLRSVPLSDIFDAYRPNGEINFRVPSAIEDGIVVPEQGVFSALSSPGEFNSRPLMMGSNRDEAKLFYAFDDEFVRTIGGIPSIRDNRFYEVFTESLSRTWRIAGVIRPTEQLADDDFQGLYTYRFDWDEEGFYYIVNVSKLLGAAHIVEVPFVFGTFDDFFGDASDIIYDTRESQRLALSEDIMSYWAEFAYSGDPGRGRDGVLTEWDPAVSFFGHRTMVLDTDQDGGVRLIADNDTLDEIKSDLVSAWGVNDDEKCRTAQEMNKIFGQAAPELAAFEDQLCPNS